MKNEDWIKDIPEQSQLGRSILAIFIAAIDLKRRSKNEWRFLFRAAGQDAIATAARMNIHVNNAATEASQFPIPVAPLAGGSMMTAELRLHPLSAEMLQNIGRPGLKVVALSAQMLLA